MKKRIRIGVVIGVLLLVMASFLYVNDYYHAGASAAALAVAKPMAEDGQLVFSPEGEVQAGLIFYPGGKVEYTAYAPLMEELSQRGILCVLVKMPCNLAFLDVNAADGILESGAQVENWYIGGHSLGGAAAGMYCGKHLDQLEGLILLGSYTTSDLRDSELEVLSIYGSEDGVLNRENYAKYAETLPENRTELVIEGGCHAGFGDYGDQKGDGIATISHEEQMEQTAEAITAFMTKEA